ncbi:sucrose-phosphate synthase family protein [Artemisia annua]|uniref:sucrose-phosphate synthase n=1 Tax=Artemisia annua TaxID=35608 RepID=A0A2U1KUY1_ARTAN|nr:sucrose-phosphate synthase family protein [Artemisia annua]
MARNEWINGYLEAILDVGANLKSQKGVDTKMKLEKLQDNVKRDKHFSPTNYFVEEVVNSVDESDLHRTWIKVIATRNTLERSNRLENMCWRIWHLTRKKKQIAVDDAQRLANRRLEREKGRHDAAEDLSELSEGEKEKGESLPVNMMSRINSEMVMWSESDENKSRQLYIVLIRYIFKESLWPYIPEFVDGALSHVVNMARSLGEQFDSGKPIWPYVIHGHYADAGEVAARLSGSLNVPMVLTGHSLGRNKFEQLLKQGRLSKEDINTTYKIMRRIEGEELALDAAEMVVTSTRQEIEEQWGLYDGFDVKLERKLRVRRRRGVSCLGRYMPRMVVIPPGMDFSFVKAEDRDGDLESIIGRDQALNKRALPPIWTEVMRFFTNPHKPMILALSRPDPKKNVTTLLKAFGECKPLRKLANLTLILGNRDDIEDMSSSSSVVLTTVLKLIDRYDLYGQVAYPKHHKQVDVPEIYRLAAKTKGVFINPALVEPFGLTIIEASAYGLPVVATKNGGPVDILKALNNGLLVDPHDQKAIEDALLKLVADKNLWADCRKHGLKNIHRFSWPEHCKNYLSHLEHCRNRHPTTRLKIIPNKEEPMSESLKDVEDLSLRFSIDGDFKANGDLDPVTRQKELIETFSKMSTSTRKSNTSYSPGRRQALYIIATDSYDTNGDMTETLSTIIKNVIEIADANPGEIGFILSTGLSLQETKEILQRCQVNLENFDALVCNSGSELYYPWRDMTVDKDYVNHTEYRWPEENVRTTIMRVARLENEDEDNLTQIKTSSSRCYTYIIKPGAKYRWPEENVRTTIMRVARLENEDEDNLTQIKTSSSRCYTYIIKPGAKTRRVDDLRQRLRMRSFRCNTVFTHAANRLNVIPLFASRAQALRYLSITWGMDLTKMFVFVGEKGDTDYEDLLVGLHKTVILKGSVEYGSEKLLRSDESFKKEDMVPSENSNVVVSTGYEVDDVSAALRSLGIK